MESMGKEYTLLWNVENYSYCRHKNGERLNSPEFIADGLEGTAWNLHLYPRGRYQYDEGCISLFLVRSQVDDGPEWFPLKFELSIIAEDGSAIFQRELQYTFEMGEAYGTSRIIQMNYLFSSRKIEYLPLDTLHVRCRVWTGEADLQTVTQITARTRIGIEKISFIHVTESFSELEPNELKTTKIKSPSKTGHDVSCSLYYTDCSCSEEKIFVKIISDDTNKILSQCKLSLLDESGKKVNCGEADNRLDANRKDIQTLPLSLTKQEIVNRKSEYLAADKFSLFCECIFSTGVEYEKIENASVETPVLAFNQMSENDQNKDLLNSTENPVACPSMKDEFKDIYNDQILNDVELKTRTKSFPAHQVVLCARSPVFRAMMTSEMKEKESKSIPIDDLEDDIVQQLLLFLYSDELENPVWESAIKLFYAGDKYQIVKLKMLCSSFLLENISVSRASELLLLADTHNDSSFKKAVEDFIMKNDKEVFGSEEWRELMESHPLLVSETMLLKYK